MSAMTASRPAYSPDNDDFLQQLQTLLGTSHVLTGDDAQPHLQDWRKR